MTGDMLGPVHCPFDFVDPHPRNESYAQSRTAQQHVSAAWAPGLLLSPLLLQFATQSIKISENSRLGEPADPQLLPYVCSGLRVD